MTDPRSVVRAVLIYSICLPLALLLGYQLTGLATLSIQSIMVIGIVLAFLSLPILLRWHHPLLVFSWNTVAIVYFLPGRPPIRLGLIAASLLISWLKYALDRRSRPQNVASITWPLMFTSAVIVATMLLTGGAGFNVLGSQVGGAGRYVALAGAILGYFALSAQPIPVEKANLYIGLFFLGGLTLAISSLAGVLPANLHYIFLFFPVDKTTYWAPTPTGLGMPRMYGIALACMAAGFYMLARYGLRGIFNTTKPWRTFFFLAFGFGVMVGGFRSFLILMAGVVAVQFLLEGLFKLKYLPIWVVVGALMISMLPFVNQLPYQMQRSLAWIPGVATPQVREDARRSTQWRLQIWERTLTEIPQYLLLGKGYALGIRDLEMAQFRVGKMQQMEEGELSELAGDYHSGPLSIIIPFGLSGVAGVLWFWIAGWRLLLHNFRHGPPELKVVNTFLLAFFCARIAHFVVVFGSFYAEFYYFTGLVGFSVAINRGLAVVRPAAVEIEQPQPEPARRLRPSLAPPAPVRT